MPMPSGHPLRGREQEELAEPVSAQVPEAEEQEQQQVLREEEGAPEQAPAQAGQVPSRARE
jgi:hypothetical protein